MLARQHTVEGGGVHLAGEPERSGSGGTGTGGETDLALVTGASFSALRVINFADGIGGASTSGAGGSGTGGIAIVQALSGGDVVISGNATLNANGQGGVGAIGTGPVGVGGAGSGGRAQVFARDLGSSVTINGIARMPTTIARSNIRPGASVTKSGIDISTRSKPKWNSMPGTRP